jgi:hypothetical protein
MDAKIRLESSKPCWDNNNDRMKVMSSRDSRDLLLLNLLLAQSVLFKQGSCHGRRGAADTSLVNECTGTYVAEELNMEKADKVYLVFERHAVESDIVQLIRVKRNLRAMHDKVALRLV